MSRIVSGRLRLLALSAMVMLSGCDLAPVYHPPQMALPTQYSGSGPFVKATPDAPSLPDDWWTLYRDPELDQLERHLNADNPDLAAAVETYTQARDAVEAASAGLMPELSLGAGVSENKESADTLFHTDTGPQQEHYVTLGATASWSPDFWGETRNRVRVAERNAQASAADLAAARLALETELASDYLAIRGLDTLHAVYQRAIGSYQKALEITRLRLAGKIAAGLDVERAQSQLSSAQAADTEVLAQRSVLEHAVAVLAGANPLDFHLEATPDRTIAIPAVPREVPSTLLQRRPDIAAAERRMASANAAIGIARAAFYPNISLSAAGGWADTGWQLATLPNTLWAVGASTMLPLFDGGLRHARLQASWSRFAQTGDQYRSVVLRAFREVQDEMSLDDRLTEESTEQTTALKAAEQVQRMALQLYTGGIDNYLNVTVAQIDALDAEIASARLKTRRLQTSVALIGALGGGWCTGAMPDEARTAPDSTSSFMSGTCKNMTRN